MGGGASDRLEHTVHRVLVCIVNATRDNKWILVRKAVDGNIVKCIF